MKCQSQMSMYKSSSYSFVMERSSRSQACTSKYAKTLVVKELGKATAKFLEIGAQFF